MRHLQLASLFAALVIAPVVFADSNTNAPAANALFPVTITVDAGKSARRIEAHLALLRRGRAELRLHEGREKIARRTWPAGRAAGLFSRASSAHERRRRVFAEIRLHQRLQGGHERHADLRLEHQRQNLRHLSRTRSKAVCGNRFHAGGALHASGKLSAQPAGE